MKKILFLILCFLFIISGMPGVSIAQNPVLKGSATEKTSPVLVQPNSNKYLADTLLIRNSDIYHYIDSVMHEGKLAQMKRRQQTLLSGEVEMGWFTLDMNRVKRYNQFEGLYLGAGGYTNKNLFRSVSMSGFAGYGFKDRKTKYGLEVSVWPYKDQHLTMNAGYSYDTRESAGSRFFDEKSGTLDLASFRFFYVNKMDYERKMNFSVFFKQNSIGFYCALQRRIIDRGYDISNGDKIVSPEQYNVSGIVAGIRLTPGQKCSQFPDEADSKNSKYPVIWLQLTRGIPGLFNGDFNYNRFEGKILITHKINHLSKSSLQVIGNLLKGNAPYFEYFNGRGSYGNFGIYASGSFVTMHPDEFMNDRSLGFFFSHDFGNILYHTGISNPSPVLVFNYGWGKLQTPPPNYYLPTMDMHKGFTEAGFQLNNLLDLKVYNLGLGAYYRMGAYRNATVKENLVFKIVIIFP